MSKHENKEKSHPEPMVTQENRAKRRKNPGFVNPNKGIQVEAGLTLQDVPREMIQQHMRQTESFWKQKFSQKYSGSHGGQQTF